MTRNHIIIESTDKNLSALEVMSVGFSKFTRSSVTVAEGKVIKNTWRRNSHYAHDEDLAVEDGC